jgi:transposase
VGPEHFGVVAVDCAKARSKWMLCDFYGKMLVPPRIVEHQRAALQLAVFQVQEACREFQLHDHIVAVEMTGTYHRPVQRAFRTAGSETRLVHPFASRHYRLPAHGDAKTDDHDLEGIFRAAVNGFGLLEPVWDERFQRLQVLARHRRDLVRKRAKLQCQIRQVLERCLPGFAALFPNDDFWTRPVAMLVAGRAETPEAVQRAGVRGIQAWLQADRVRAQDRTVERIVAWAANAAAADPLAPTLARVRGELYEDWQAKTRQITRVEGELAEILVKTPYVLLLSHPGIGVVSAAELAGEMGPIEHYASAKAITGRAGLFPSRYQSDEVDRRDGPLAHFRNARLRAAWMRVADNLVKCNAHYRGKSQFWKQRGVDPRDIRCRVANRATRTIFQMVSGRQVYRHPSRLGRQYILDKLLKFHQEHHSAPVEILRDLQAAAELIPRTEITAETAPLQPIADRYRRARRKGPQPVGEIVLVLLARLGAGSWPEADGELQSEPSRVEASDRLTSRIDASHR